MMRVVERREWLEGDEVRREVTFEEARTGHRRVLRASREAFETHPAGSEVAPSFRSTREDGC